MKNPEEVDVTGITAPSRASGRIQARDLFASLPESLMDGEVVVDFEQLDVVTPSFVDEMVLIVLAERHAAKLHLVNVDDRTQQFATRSALARQVHDRLLIDHRVA